MLADVGSERRHGGLIGPRGERKRHGAYVADRGRDRIPRAFLRSHDRENADAPALLHKVLDEDDVLRRQRVTALQVLVAAVLDLRKEGMRFVNDDDDEWPSRRRSHLPQVADAEDLADHRRAALAELDQPPQRQIRSLEVVTGKREKPWCEIFVVPATFAVDDRELNDRGRR